MSITFVDAALDVPKDLWDACFAGTVEGQWWYEALEASGLEDQFTFKYAVIHDGSVPIGIAPFFLMNLQLSLVAPPAVLPILTVCERAFPKTLSPRILFVGSPCADEGTVGMVPHADRKRALLSLQTALEQKAHELGAAILVWKDCPARLAEDLQWVAARCRLVEAVSFPGTVVDLKTPCKNDYFGALKSSRRQDLRRMLRRSSERIAVRNDVLRNPDSGMLDEMFSLFQQTYERAPIKLERLNRRFFDIVARQQGSHFITLRERSTDQLVAFSLCFEDGGQVINKFGGLDYKRPKSLFLNYRLWDAILDWALARGAMSIQSGQTGYAAKIEVGHRLIPMSNFFRHQNVAWHTVMRLFARKISWQTLDRDLAFHIKSNSVLDVGPRS
jgi:hypothetical protein